MKPTPVIECQCPDEGLATQFPTHLTEGIGPSRPTADVHTSLGAATFVYPLLVGAALCLPVLIAVWIVSPEFGIFLAKLNGAAVISILCVCLSDGLERCEHRALQYLAGILNALAFTGAIAMIAVVISGVASLVGGSFWPT
jgi:hypothetical protein